MQIKVIYVSVQPLHNRQFVIPHKRVELIAWTRERLEINFAKNTLIQIWTSDFRCVQRDNYISIPVKVGSVPKMDCYSMHYNF